MMPHKKSAMGRSRDFGISNAAGKGDASRITDQTKFAANFDEVAFEGVKGLKKVGTKLVKTYGKTKPADVFAETDGEWQPLGNIHKTATPPTNDICRE